MSKEKQNELLLINENKSNNFDVKSNNELFKQALVEGLSNKFDKAIEEAKEVIANSATTTEKQIEEMAEIIHKADVNNDTNTIWFPLSMAECLNKHGAKRTNASIALYNAGYRKQSEWISVEDRLPDCEWGAESKAVLFITKQGTMYTGYYGCGGIYRDRYFREYKNSTDGYDISFITHWMPLPEAPKMKGGE